MQQRFHRTWAATYLEAAEAKQILETGNPEGTYQIRRRKNNFEVVIRLPASKAAVEATKTDGYTKRKKRRKRDHQGYQALD